MANNQGMYGAVYSAVGYLNAETIAFHENTPSADTITDSANGFVTAGFVNGATIIVTGSTSNNAAFTAATVAAGTITLDPADDLLEEVAGDKVTIRSSAPGTALLGFYNWAFDNSADMLDKTTFASAGNREFMAGLKTWTATCEKHFETTSDQSAWIGTAKWIRLFVKYVAVPSGGDPAYFYEGAAYLSALGTSEPIDGLVDQTLTFTGSGALSALVTKTSAW